MSGWQIFLLNFGSQAFPFACGFAICYLINKVRNKEKK